MAGATDQQAWLVVLLIPDAAGTSVLAVAGGQNPEGCVTLPTLRFDSEPSVREVLERLEFLDGQHVNPLRLNELREGPDGEAGALLVEFDGSRLTEPTGYGWIRLDADAAAGLEPTWARGAILAWMSERRQGWSPRRPAWSRPGWFERASAWMVEQMAADDAPALSPPLVHHLWDLSVVLRAPSARGDVFLKCSTDVFRHEAVVTQALAARLPDVLPGVITVEPGQGWLLMRDLGGAELGTLDESLWPAGAAGMARIQGEWSGRSDELAGLGIVARPLGALAELVRDWATDATLLARMDDDLRRRWPQESSSLADACLRLDSLGPSPTIVHGDLHPWNVSYDAGKVRVFDWTDAAISHPFVDLATYVFRTEQTAIRRRTMDANLAEWTDHLAGPDLHEAGMLALSVGSLYQVQTYRMLTGTLMDPGRMANVDIEWVRRALSRRERGLESPK